MPYRPVRGFPEEGPYNKLEIDKDCWTFTFVKIEKDRMICLSQVNEFSRESSAPKNVQKKAFAQAQSVFKSSAKKASRPT